jgi:molecular chaperone DnaK (HSP70)
VNSRYLIGIDLGTTNSVVAYIDTQESSGATLHVFPIPQLAAPGEVRSFPALPSFLYFPTAEELSAGAVSATWNEDPPMVTGVHAREQGALVPSRQVSSAKSWLSHSGVDRRAKILPAQAEPPQPMISPVDASARYLMHLRDAWNNAVGKDAETRFEQQDIVLTVPASFDEEARELTVEAARSAGLGQFTLLEEPLAAFYAWIAANRETRAAGLTSGLGQNENGEGLREGELILICDVGGGTTDFSLVRTRSADGKLQFERTAIGEHLLLGGDNLDFALARRAQEKLPDVQLTLRQRYALRRACCAAKERLLSDPALARVPVTILGSGHSVIGQTLSVELERHEVLEMLASGFLPITAPNDIPAHSPPAGLRELGLPYASDPAITRHLAAFLRQAAGAMNHSSSNPQLARPDAVLFNGGFFTPAVTRERIVETISTWFGATQNSWRPKLLTNNAVESAVARGAAYYGQVRRGAGLRIRADSPRTYYIGLRPDNDKFPLQPDGRLAASLQGICVLPAGAEEGVTLPPLNREFSVLANRPVSFTLYSSRTRRDAPGEVVALHEAGLHRHAPLVALLRYGKKLRELNLTVRLRAGFTEVGTLELWCESRDTPHRWRLQFELRGEEETLAEPPAAANLQSARARLSTVAAGSEARVESAAQLIRRVFSRSADGDDLSPETLVSRMEAVLGTKRESWPAAALRRFLDVLIEVAAGRKESSRHEVRWLNLSGFCLRPGFGAPGDHARVDYLRTLTSNELTFPDNLQSQIESLVLLRRIAGGINAGDQQALCRTRMNAAGKKKGRVNRQLEYERWRLAASLEHLPASTRATLGHELLEEKIRKEPTDAIWLWALGRLGARIPLYGPLHSTVTSEVAGKWLKELLELPAFTTATASSILLIARRTDDRSRDIDDAAREQAISRLQAFEAAQDIIPFLAKYIPPEHSDAVRSFGESLPSGLELVSSPQCLLSVPGLRSSSPVFSRLA